MLLSCILFSHFLRILLACHRWLSERRELYSVLNRGALVIRYVLVAVAMLQSPYHPGYA